MHPIDELFATMAQVAPYPSGVVEVPGRIRGITFFPGGPGLWGVKADSHLPPLPIGGIMVLGHNYDSEAGFGRTSRRGTEVMQVGTQAAKNAGFRGDYKPCNPTWSGLWELLPEVPVPWERCFFTNAYMGLRKGSKATGRFPGSTDSAFVNRCRDFLRVQLSKQQPAIVLTLGAWVPAFVAELSEQLSPWRGIQSVPELDRLKMGPVTHGVTFPNSGAPPCSVVALTHPSRRHLNVDRRRFKVGTRAFEGHEAEVAMVREAIRASPLRGHAA
jgi:uracil-DNA glycosylase